MEIAKTIPLHCTLELEGIRDQGRLNGRTNLHGVVHGYSSGSTVKILGIASYRYV